jgi:hypothetical protein
MKLTGTLVLGLLLVAVLIAGCVQQPTGPSGDGAQLTQAEMEQQAYNTLEQEMEQAIDEMTLQEIENELLQQG